MFVISLLGIQPALLQRLQSFTTLPSFDSWILPEDDVRSLDEDDEDDDSISDSPGAEIQAILDREQECTASRTLRQEQQILNMTCAALSLTLEEMSQL